MNELQKKYDESKRNYLRIRDERERLKVDLEQAKGGGTSGAISTGEASVAAESKPKALAASASSMSDVQAKYEGLKTKLKVSRRFCNALLLLADRTLRNQSIEVHSLINLCGFVL